MFRKSFTIKSQTLLRASDAKKLRVRVNDQFGPYCAAQTAAASVKEPSSCSRTKLPSSCPDLAAVLFGNDKNAPISAVKIITHAGAAVTIYVVNGLPIVFTDTTSTGVNSHDQIYIPTVFGLWKGAVVMGCFVVPGPVIPRLFNGADLMIPGMISHPGSIHPFNVGDALGVCAHGSSIPLVVGTALRSSFEIEQLTLNRNLHGKVLHTLHTYGDKLWEFGGKTEPPLEINLLSLCNSSVDFLDCMSEQSASLVSPSDIHPTLQKASADKPDGWTLVDADIEPDVRSISDSDADPNWASDMLNTVENLDDLVLVDNLPSPSELAEIICENDRVLQTSFLTAALLKIKEEPPGSLLDIKKTSFKKLSKFYKTLEKQGVLKTKEQAGETRIISINFTHPLPGDTKNGHTPRGKLSAVELYKVANSGNIGILFKELSKIHDLSEYMTLSDIRRSINAYAAENKLFIATDRRLIKFDLLLRSVVLNKGDDPLASSDSMRSDLIIERIIGKLLLYHQVKIGSVDQIIRKGPVPIVQVLVKKRGGPAKLSTHVLNLQHYTEKLDDIAHEIRVRCSTSAAVSGTSAIPELVVQGSKAFEICQTLDEILGIPMPHGLLPLRSGTKPKPCTSKFVNVG
ncbi:hypothetical protein BASA83_005585 [Batrachochytrium salamandrivorans]|nr:hypothetical protein BASA83_005585 [Batrachochytrium salamandrivorans]